MRRLQFNRRQVKLAALAAVTLVIALAVVAGATTATQQEKTGSRSADTTLKPVAVKDGAVVTQDVAPQQTPAEQPQPAPSAPQQAKPVTKPLPKQTAPQAAPAQPTAPAAPTAPEQKTQPQPCDYDGCRPAIDIATLNDRICYRAIASQDIELRTACGKGLGIWATMNEAIHWLNTNGWE